MFENFLGLTKKQFPYENCKVAILPIPYERTTSYIKGTENGPKALLNASPQLEFYDSELKVDITKPGIFTLPKLKFSNKKNEVKELDKIYNAALEQIENGKWLVSLGGEHTVTVPLVKAFREKISGDFGVV